MANNAATEFLKKVLSDEALRARVADLAQAVAVAAELGFEVTEEELVTAKKEFCRQNSAEVVELDEADMDRAAGGSRDWIKQGCAATVEAGSRCWSNDFCIILNVEYSHEPTCEECPKCGNAMCYNGYTTKGGAKAHYICPNCGTETTRTMYGEVR
ncbi:MAG: Nif11-like leader peptide family natural product precursor [Clostridia bacterium]|nr:Nif11-like leader peptide family natural product precursor [Clostridia bacterium]